MRTATLSGSYGDRTFVLVVSDTTWDRFRDARVSQRTTNGALLATIADSRPDPDADLTEADINGFLDQLDLVPYDPRRGMDAPPARNST
jgi:hypothetical protein